MAGVPVGIGSRCVLFHIRHGRTLLADCILCLDQRGFVKEQRTLRGRLKKVIRKRDDKFGNFSFSNYCHCPPLARDIEMAPKKGHGEDGGLYAGLHGDASEREEEKPQGGEPGEI